MLDGGDTLKPFPDLGSALPTGWRRARLDDVVDRASGHTPDQGKPEYWNGGVSWVSLADSAKLDQGYIEETDKQISHLGIRHSSAVLLPPETVILSRDAGVGKSAVLKTEMAVSQHFIAWSCSNKDVLDPWFLYAWMQTQKPFFERMAVGSTIKTIGLPIFKRLTIDFPPLPEQRKIAEILRTWDEALEKLTTLRALNIRRRVWFRTHLFTGKVRLPGFTGEWRVVPLSAVLHEHGSRSTGAEEVFSVSVHKGLVNQIEHLGRSFSAANTDHYNRVLPGDIVYTKSPTGDFPLGIIKQSKIDREVIVSPLYGVFTPQTYALGVIFDALFESPLAARNYLYPLVQKGAKNTIAVTNNQFLEGKLRLPMDPAEQAAIADIANASHAECAGIEAEIEALTRQKRGLMQKLLTGEWRVSQ
ncbi:restriction endonuclease subunit S [Mesobacterium pallidum]|uniref:restriction endonuclease subunit S n=1 Tax=Mesobacterium pallidum TaxID=2872037 RepID=UPI001EE1AF69|nr:restriction endonuclease subunit S [Mesobacterium pallidum]